MIPSMTRLIKGLAIAAGVIVLSILPPGLHFVLGPLAPLVGGFLAGAIARLRGGEALILGLTEGIVAGLSVGVLFPRLGHLHLAVTALWFFGLTAALYAGILGGVAAYFGGRSSG